MTTRVALWMIGFALLACTRQREVRPERPLVHVPRLPGAPAATASAKAPSPALDAKGKLVSIAGDSVTGNYCGEEPDKPPLHVEGNLEVYRLKFASSAGQFDSKTVGAGLVRFDKVVREAIADQYAGALEHDCQEAPAGAVPTGHD